jgi:hypothetical protein
MSDLHHDKAAAEYLGVKPKSLANWRSEGRGPAYLKIGGRVLYEIEELKRFRDACRVRPGEAA